MVSYCSALYKGRRQSSWSQVNKLVFSIKQTVRVISSKPPCKDGNSRCVKRNNCTLETLIWTQNVQDTPSFFSLEKCFMLLISKKCLSHFRRETSHENKLFKEGISHEGRLLGDGVAVLRFPECLLERLLAAAPGPLACPSRGAWPLSPS